MKQFFVDLHVHIGRSFSGLEIKKATANNLTFENVAYESYFRKGIEIIGAVDCISPFVADSLPRSIAWNSLRINGQVVR